MYVDAKIVVDSYYRGPEGTKMSSMSDLWDDVWAALDKRSHGSMTLIWTKSHPSPEEVLLHKLQPDQLFLNSAADHFAGVASAREAKAAA